MKRTSKLTAILLAVCLAATTMATGVTAGAAGTARTVSTEAELNTALANAQDGDTIVVSNTIVLTDNGKNDIPWILDKRITFEGTNGGNLTLWRAGIALNNDVTFRNIDLAFPYAVQNAILANGHTLTLENVTSKESAFPINLFCGGYAGRSSGTDFDTTLLKRGSNGTIIIKGNTNLQGKIPDADKPANIYAGNLCLGGMYAATSTQNGPSNSFDGTATIQIENGIGSSTSAIYACGAQQKAGADEKKVILTDTAAYRVNGDVNITLSTAVPVHGKGSPATNVTYKDTGNGYETTATLYDINDLTVEKGNLKLGTASIAKSLAVASGARLNIVDSDIAAITSFTGGGSLVMGQSQTLTISGAVTGTTKVGIGGFNFNGTQSSALPTLGKTYIQAANSSNDSFQLAPYGNQPKLKFTRNNTGAWIVTNDSTGENTERVTTFHFEHSTQTVPSGGGTDNNGQTVSEIDLPLVVEPELTYLDEAPIIIKINDSTANKIPDDKGYYDYSLNGLSMRIAENHLCILNMPTHVPDGKYNIEITIPGTHTASGNELKASTTLTVGTPPALTSVEIPAAVTGLKWTGQPLTGVPEGLCYTITGHTATNVGSYTATATLKDGYKWSDDTTGAKTIPWSIAKADGPAAPTGLTATAPTSAGGTNGKISGTNSTMEYANNAGFTNPKDCTGTEITGLAAGTYYVRVKATGTHQAGSAATVTVPAYTDPGSKPTEPSKPSNPGDPGNNPTPDKPSTSKPGGTTTNGTTTKPDGSSVTTTTDKATGTVTVTTKRPDGSQRVEESRKDGTVVTTEKAANGSTTQTIQFNDGSKDTNINQADGLTASLSVDANGKTTGEVRLPAQLSGGALPIPALPVAYNSQNASTLTLYTGRSAPVQVAIPTQTTSPGTVAVLVKPGGQEEVIKTSVAQNGSLVVEVPNGACIKLMDRGKSFADTNQHWAKDAIAFTSARDLFSGTSAIAFTPDGPMGRDMLMTVLARFDGVDTSGGSTWSEKGMAWAVANGISDGSDPSGHISREQLVTMLYRYAGSPTAGGSQALSFRDAEHISEYAWNAVNWAVANGILNGFADNSLDPRGDTTRAQAATIFMHYAQYLAR